MKYTYCFFISIFILSCGVDNQESVKTTKDEIYARTDAPVELEIKMQWTSFLTGIALEQDQGARADLLAIIDDYNHTVAIEDLLEESSTSPNFKSKFLEVLDWYSLIICQTGKPEPGPVPPTGPLVPGCAEEFLTYILEDNCIELFFPNGLELNPVLPISTTAHPLTNADNNYGYLRYEKTPGTTLVQEKTIDPEYLIYKDIIVARPVDGVECDYTGWGVDDFTLFLNI